MASNFDDDEIIQADSGGETWLTSYADLMTLIACFFILIVAFANYEDPGFQEKAREFSQFFNRDNPIVVDKAVDKNINAERPISNKTNSENILSSKNKTKKLSTITEIDKKGSFQIDFSASAVFEPGKISLTEEVRSSVEVIINLIKERPDIYYIIVEGHTDDTDINSQKYPSNWELSAARAAIIIKEFEKSGIETSKMVAVAYGNSNPLYPNRDEEGKPIKKNQRLNRRVVIKVLKNSEIEKKEVGPNILFKK